MDDFSAYVQHGWKLCALESGQKGPTYNRWNTAEKAAEIGEAAEALVGAGLIHELSGTCALDIDDESRATKWLAQHDINLRALLSADDAVSISSGTPNRIKLLYRMKRAMRTIKPPESGVEFRSAKAQDVLPPSKHPSGRPYVWVFGLLGDWEHLPPVPPALLALWRTLAGNQPDKPLPPPQSVPSKTPKTPKPDLSRLRKAAFKHSPDAEYDEWIKVGMQLHDGTGGAQEGFDIWAEWSRGIKRKPYPGDDVLKTHWVSFRSDRTKFIATAETLESELPADPEDFAALGVGVDAEEQASAQTAVANKQAMIAALEQRLVYVSYSGLYFDTEQRRLIPTNYALDHEFAGSMPDRSGRRILPSKHLLESRTKQRVHALAFHPGEGVIFKDRANVAYANTYKPLNVEPLEPTPTERATFDWLFNRIDDEQYRHWLMQLFAHVVQRPRVKIRSAPLIWAREQGSGKSTLLKDIPALLVGQHHSMEVTSGLLNSDFNDYLANMWHINLAEFRAGTRGEREAISKKVENWIADSTLAMNAKGKPGYTTENHLFVTATSNFSDAAAIDANDRKWAVHELRAPEFTEADQTRVQDEFLQTPRAAGVLRYIFLNYPLTGFNPNARALRTADKDEMAGASMAIDESTLISAWEERAPPFDRDVVLTSQAAEFLKGVLKYPPNPRRIGALLCGKPFNGVPKQWRCGDRTYRGVILRNFRKWEGAAGVMIQAHIENNTVADLTL